MTETEVAVLGGGLQGSAVALELASNGIRVDLYERETECMSQASAQNECKIHLGYVFANDPSLATARILSKGAFSFAPLMKRWLGDEFDNVSVSSPFYYLVHNDSMLPLEALERHYNAVHAINCEDKKNGDYFGISLNGPPTRVARSDYEGLCDPGRVQAIFQTSEIGIDPQELARLVKLRLAAEPNIRIRSNTTIVDIMQDRTGVTVASEHCGVRHFERYGHAVNALWSGRLALDAKLGLVPRRPWSFRVKYFLRLQLRQPADFPSTTIVLGPFGDTVNYRNGALFLSWYPIGMRGMSSDIVPPGRPKLRPDTEAEIRDGIVDALVPLIPRLSALDRSTIDNAQIKGGIIFAWGDRDISDVTSELHHRHDIGPESFGRYHSIDTGKLTMAPFFAKQISDHIRTSL